MALDGSVIVTILSWFVARFALANEDRNVLPSPPLYCRPNGIPTTTGAVHSILLFPGPGTAHLKRGGQN
jgi:hypothetical protein